MMSHASGHLFFEKSQSLATPYKPGDDLRPLQFAFGRLFDEASQTIYYAGSDLDEVLVERILIVRQDQTAQHEVPADFLSDPELLKRSVLKNLAALADSAETEVFDIVAVKIIARRDELPGRTNRIQSASDGRSLRTE